MAFGVIGHDLNTSLNHSHLFCLVSNIFREKRNLLFRLDPVELILGLGQIYVHFLFPFFEVDEHILDHEQSFLRWFECQVFYVLLELSPSNYQISQALLVLHKSNVTHLAQGQSIIHKLQKWGESSSFLTLGSVLKLPSVKHSFESLSNH